MYETHQELINRQQNKPEKNYIELTPGMPVWHDWKIITGGIPQFPYEPITGVDRFNVLSIQECSSADWNAESGGNTLNMSQHCPVMVSNSKQ